MHLANLLLLASSAAAVSLPNFLDVSSLFTRDILARSSGSCPAVWTQISKDLTAKFLTDGQCNPDARAAIRAVFHDCGAWNKAQGAKGGCDGSLILANEVALPENNGLQGIAAYLQTLASNYKVGVADMIVFAGSHAIVTCPGGPRVQTYVGRKDSSTPAPEGLLPDVNASADSLYKLFLDKGLDASDLAALLGSHSTSNQFHFDESAGNVGAPQDSTPGIWDVKYYSETTAPPKGVLVLPSDAKLAAHATVGKEFKGFVNNAGKWNGKFADAMARMERFGSNGTNGLIDCTKALPSATNAKREFRGMPMFKPRH
ncbi:class II peroxidase [Didymella exigua CBS 183.55]|uniref:Peroxidase n=1 Tax=Didymella exigua CBS 183.55 TaxID=1150837 RepID=A0A6A5S0K2_9PLEO|nr:class II peroxidase [Didymella exigua CBS 183.55]KAF1933309.1 class II peroxidase [Didymella exigua CBS 183.55]